MIELLCVCSRDLEKRDRVPQIGTIFASESASQIEAKRMQRRIQQLAGAALDSLGLSKIDDPDLLSHLASLESMEISLRYSGCITS